jgi:OOP family OmpA-OmpF porin
MQDCRPPIKNSDELLPGPLQVPENSLPSRPHNPMKTTLIALGCLTTSLIFAVAEDIEGSKDHPMFSRMPNFYIGEYRKNFDSLEFPVAEEKTAAKEGNTTVITYSFIEDTGKKMPSPLQVLRNYQAAVVKLGGELVYEVPKDSATFKLKKNNQEVWLKVGDFANGGPGEVGNYVLSVVEIAAMNQDVVAKDLLDALNRDGHVALDIHFDIAKAVIKAESQPIITKMIALMKENPELKVEIQGHTDNTGDPAGNQALSEKRATAVKTALVEAQIESSRMTAKGYGRTKPVADNATDDGKAKNRRVELVKQ